ncbi:MAG: hypothetical protein R2708_17210 [Vicinamibacterales bacterium]
MGVTIHFEGQLRDEAAYQRVVEAAARFATASGWTSEPIAEPFVTLKRVRSEEDVDYEGPVKGIVLRPHENADPLRLEFDSDLYVQEYCKTQFAPAEIHLQVIALLRQIESEFAQLAVEDEGEYWSTADRVALEGHLATCSRALAELLTTDSGLRGPGRGPDDRIVDFYRE